MPSMVDRAESRFTLEALALPLGSTWAKAEGSPKATTFRYLVPLTILTFLAAVTQLAVVLVKLMFVGT